MTKIRVQKEAGNFTVIDNTAIEDKTLSWQAKGLHTYLMHLPDSWEINVADLTKRSDNGRDSTAAALRELVNAGYIRREARREAGKFSGYDYSVFQRPIPPETGKPDTVKPDTENPKQVNTKGVSTNEVKVTSLRSVTSAGTELTTTERPTTLHAAILKAFESKTGKLADYKKEGAITKKLVERITSVANGDAWPMARAMIGTFWLLIQTGKKVGNSFWGEQPFTPSGLSPLFERVRAQMSSVASGLERDDEEARVAAEAAAAIARLGRRGK